MIKAWLAGAIVALSLTMAVVTPVLAETDPGNIVRNSACQTSSDPAACSSNTSDVFSSGLIRKVADTVIYLVAIVAIVFLLIAAIRYTISGGDPNQVKEAKDTILYALIGLIVATLAYAAVHFVIKSETRILPGCPGSGQNPPKNFDPSKC